MDIRWLLYRYQKKLIPIHRIPPPNHHIPPTQLGGNWSNKLAAAETAISAIKNRPNTGTDVLDSGNNGSLDNGSEKPPSIYTRQLQSRVKPLKCYGCCGCFRTVHPHIPYLEPLPYIPKKLIQKMMHVMYQFGPTLLRCFYTRFKVVKLRRYGMALRGGFS